MNNSRKNKSFIAGALRGLLTTTILSTSIVAGVIVEKPAQSYIDSCRTIEYNSMGCRSCEDMYSDLVRFARLSGFNTVQEYVESVLREEIEYQSEIESQDCWGE